MKKFLLVIFFVLFSLKAHAEVKIQIIEYKDGDTVLQGFLAYDTKFKGKRPGVIVVHDWMGFGEYGNKRAKMLAELGYVALAVDIYGKDARPKNTDEAAQQAGYFKEHRDVLRRWAKAGYEALKNEARVDGAKIAAIGYCFGGTTVLEMARGGLDLAGVVSFHGGLNTPNPDETEEIKSKILVLHGADDPFVPPLEVAAFQKEMNSAQADWQMVYYSGAVHSFTRKDAGDDPTKGAAYNEKADKRSWEAMKAFFAEALK